MANKNVLTVVFDAVEQDLSHVFAAVVNELHSGGNTVHTVRVMNDSGENALPVNTIPGVTVPEPVPLEPVTPANETEPDSDETATQEHTEAGSSVPGAPEDLTIEEKRAALLDQLDKLEEEEAAAGDPTGTGTEPGNVAS